MTKGTRETYAGDLPFRPLGGPGRLPTRGSHEFADFVQVFDTRSGEEVARGTGFKHVSGVLFLSADVLLVAAFGGCYRCNLRRGGRDLLSDKGWQTGVTLSPDGRALAIGEDFGLAWVDLVKKKETHRFGACFLSVHQGYCAGFSPGGRYLAGDLHIGGRAGGLVGQLRCTWP
ncbi:MAG TPA: hypothetical protein VEL76_03490 [Gemmataceae bacterium]|nr:hypothetical protein [Gemmataceae bacterium]